VRTRPGRRGHQGQPRADPKDVPDNWPDDRKFKTGDRFEVSEVLDALTPDHENDDEPGYIKVGELRKILGSELCGLRAQGSETYETDYSAGNILVAGMTDEGLHFGFEVLVSEPYRIDP
jgi:hypothetical protein